MAGSRMTAKSQMNASELEKDGDFAAPNSREINKPNNSNCGASTRFYALASRASRAQSCAVAVSAQSA